MKAKKFELSPYVGYHAHQKTESPSPLIKPYIGKNVSLIAFTQKLLQSLLEINPLIQNSVHYTLKHLLETLGMGKNPIQQPKIYSFPPPEKSPLLNLLLPLSKILFLPHQIGIFI